MEYLVGVVLALVVGLATSWVGFDRDRALYPVVMIVIAAYYLLFSVIGASREILLMEGLVAAVFIAASVAGFKRSLWIVVAALAAHGLFDAVHGYLMVNPGVPAWWPAFCAAYDLVAAAYLAVLLKSQRVRHRA